MDRETYDRSIALLRGAVSRARIEEREKRAALNRLESTQRLLRATPSIFT